jgi:TM2 domain-containing membrane protein YozV
MAKTLKPVSELSLESKKTYQATWLLSLLLGFVGADRFYLGQWKFGLLKLGALVFASVVSASVGPSVFSWGPFVALYLLDLWNAVFGRLRDKQGLPVTNIPDKKLTQQILSGVVSFFLFVSAVTGGDSEQSGTGNGAGAEDTDASVQEQQLTEGIMPNFVGYTPRQVAETLEVLDVREGDVVWPRSYEPRDEEFEADADIWFVCEQELKPGDEIESAYNVWLGWGKNCVDYKKVPDFVGLVGKEAYDLARDRGLGLDSFSSFRTNEDRTVCTQETPVGSVIPSGKYLDESEIKVVFNSDCEVFYAEQAEREAYAQQEAEEEAARVERERILSDPNTFEGGRRFINFHKEWLANDIALIDEYRRWLDAGAVIDDPDSWGGPILDALFGDIPYMPGVTDDMWEQAPTAYQEKWLDLIERLEAAEEAHDEASTLRTEDIYSISEELPYVREVRALTVEALNLVNSMPYPQQ